MTDTAKAKNRVPKVLVADDDQGIARFLAAQCTKMGFDVQTVSNGVHALVMVTRNRPDVLIVDFNMPQLDGLSVCTQLLRPGKTPIHIVLVTANPHLETVKQCESLGAHYVRKGADLWDRVRAKLVEIFPDMAVQNLEAEKSTAGAEAWKRPRILVIDPDPGVGAFLSSRLQKCGVDTLTACDPIQGYRIACREEPSVVITDYRMPGGDAHFLLWRLRSTASTASIPVFLMTANRLDEANRLELTREVNGRPGVARFLVKSFDTGELFTALQKFCAFTNNASSKAI